VPRTPIRHIADRLETSAPPLYRGEDLGVPIGDLWRNASCRWVVGLDHLEFISANSAFSAVGYSGISVIGPHKRDEPESGETTGLAKQLHHGHRWPVPEKIGDPLMCRECRG